MVLFCFVSEHPVNRTNSNASSNVRYPHLDANILSPKGSSSSLGNMTGSALGMGMYKIASFIIQGVSVFGSRTLNFFGKNNFKIKVHYIIFYFYNFLLKLN